MLFVVFLFFPVFHNISRNSLILFLLIISLYFIPIPDTFYVNHGLIREFLLFFYFGFLYAQCNYKAINQYSTYLCFSLLGIFIVLYMQGDIISEMLISFVNNKIIIYKFIRILLTTLAILIFYYFSVLISNSGISFYRLIKHVGIYSAPIYLFHNIAIGVPRIILIDILNIKENLYPMASILILMSGVFIPILITKHFINKFDFLPPLLLGTNKV